MTEKSKNDHWRDLAGEMGADSPAKEGEGDEPLNFCDDTQDNSGNDSQAEVNNKPCEPEKDVMDDPKETKKVEIAPQKPSETRLKSGWDDLAEQFDLPRPVIESTTNKADEPLASETSLEDRGSPSCVEEDEKIAETQDSGLETKTEEEKQEARETAWQGVEHFDALFDDAATEEANAVTSEADQQPSFDDIIAAVSVEMEKENTESHEEEERGEKRRYKRRRSNKSKIQKLSTEKDHRDYFAEGLEGDSELEGAVQSVSSDDGEEKQAAISRRDASEAEEGKQKRGRRRRRGPRRRKDSQKSVAEDSMDEAKDVLAQDLPEEIDHQDVDIDANSASDERKVSDDTKQRKGRRRRGEGGSEKKKTAASHRGIPTWDEAVECIISANLENRSKKTAASSPSRSKSGQGRSGRERANSRKRSNK